MMGNRKNSARLRIKSFKPPTDKSAKEWKRTPALCFRRKEAPHSSRGWRDHSRCALNSLMASGPAVGASPDCLTGSKPTELGESATVH